MMIPFNDIYSIAHERDNEIRKAANPDYRDSMQQREPRQTIAAFLHRLRGDSQAPADTTWVQGIEPGR